MQQARAVVFSLLIILLTFSGEPVHAESTVEAHQPPTVARVYILAGQSNMQGGGQAKELEPSWRQPIDGAFIVNGDKHTRLDPGQLATKGSRFGPEIGFAHHLRNNQPQKPHVYLIKFALSSQPLDPGWDGGAADGSSWVGAEPGPGRKTFYPGTGPDDPNIGQHYKKLHDYIAAGIKGLKDKGYVPEVQGIVWMQGEQDSKNEVSAGRYDQMLALLKHRLEQDFIDGRDVPLVFGQVLPHDPPLKRYTHRDLIRHRMAGVDWRSGSEGAVSNIWMVPTDGLELLKDTVHYSTKGQLELGQAFGIEMLKAERNANAHDVPAKPEITSPQEPIGWCTVDRLGQVGTTGGAAGLSIVVRTGAELIEALKRKVPLKIYVRGTIDLDSALRIEGVSDKSILGLGDKAKIQGEVRIRKGSSNIIIRNIHFDGQDTVGDALSINGQSDNDGDQVHHIWIDHCTFSRYTDGLIDITHAADFITISWCHFHSSDRVSLVGHSDSNANEDTGHLTVTYHHNWFDHTRQRHPRVRFSQLVHLFNNFYDLDENAIYGTVSVERAYLLLENNYFSNIKIPFKSSSGHANSGPGFLVARGNAFHNCGETREENGKVPDPPYRYSLDPAEDVPNSVRKGAGAGVINFDNPFGLHD